jgi:single-stranded DNA-binding protein
MNHLNSVLIEGVIKDRAQLRETSEGTSVCTISVVNKRVYRDEVKIHECVSNFIVEVGGKLGEAVFEKGKKGRGVRVVSWLKEEQHIGGKKQQSRIIIMADHVEFRVEQEVESRKPVKKGEQTKRPGSRKK